jgi:hypothetical protein
MTDVGLSTRAEWCRCVEFCGDDGDIDGDGRCKGKPIEREPLVEIVLVHRSTGEVVG